MYAVVRNYTGPGSKELFDLLEQNKAEVERLIRAVPGFVSYTLLRSSDGGASVTVCSDKAGTDASIQAARDWIVQHASHLSLSPPSVAEGGVVLQLD